MLFLYFPTFLDYGFYLLRLPWMANGIESHTCVPVHRPYEYNNVYLPCLRRWSKWKRNAHSARNPIRSDFWCLTEAVHTAHCTHYSVALRASNTDILLERRRGKKRRFDEARERELIGIDAGTRKEKYKLFMLMWGIHSLLCTCTYSSSRWMKWLHMHCTMHTLNGRMATNIFTTNNEPRLQRNVQFVHRCSMKMMEYPNCVRRRLQQINQLNSGHNSLDGELSAPSKLLDRCAHFMISFWCKTTNSRCDQWLALGTIDIFLLIYCFLRCQKAEITHFFCTLSGYLFSADVFLVDSFCRRMCLQRDWNIVAVRMQCSARIYLLCWPKTCCKLTVPVNGKLVINIKLKIV